MIILKKIKDRLLAIENEKIRKEKEQSLNKKLQMIYANNERIEVIRGPFKGMLYPDFVSTGSALYPKLAGIYEKELQPIIYKILEKKYKYILDVGCAEGYYAIGLAKQYGAKIYAYDIDDNARKLCDAMAQVNSVKINICEECTIEELKSFDFSNSLFPSLIISDCEGFERELFCESDIDNLKNVECIIEVHDWLQFDTPTLDYLINLFKETHDYEVIYGIDDYEKVYRYRVEELEMLSKEEKFKTFAEYRRRLGEWIYFTPKH